jgi:hypothetical protein
LHQLGDAMGHLEFVLWYWKHLALLGPPHEKLQLVPRLEQHRLLAASAHCALENPRLGYLQTVDDQQKSQRWTWDALIGLLGILT